MDVIHVEKLDDLKQLLATYVGEHGNDNLFLYRGQADEAWDIDSTFCRYLWAEDGPHRAAAMSNDQYHTLAKTGGALIDEFFGKYDVVEPSAELTETMTANPGMDDWFELMKRYQQYPDEDNHVAPKGTNVVDFTMCPYIACFFAFEEDADSDVAIWRIATHRTGRTFIRGLLRDTLESMRKYEADQPCTPLLFCPPKQLTSERANAQKARYVLQCDFRYSLNAVWEVKERKERQRIIEKIVVPRSMRDEVLDWLSKMNISERMIYPDKAVQHSG